VVCYRIYEEDVVIDVILDGAGVGKIFQMARNE